MEARIGDVKTGLSKDFILNNLRTHVHEADGVSSDSDASWDDTCIICQVFFIVLLFLEYMLIGFSSSIFYFIHLCTNMTLLSFHIGKIVVQIEFFHYE